MAMVALRREAWRFAATLSQIITQSPLQSDPLSSPRPPKLASADVSMSIFNILSKAFNIPLLNVATSFVAEDIARSAGKSTSGRCIWLQGLDTLQSFKAYNSFESNGVYENSLMEGKK